MHNSKYDFQAHPICIYGIRAIVYESPKDRATWANHGVDGFYIGPEIRHYRCWEFTSCQLSELAPQTQCNGYHKHSNFPKAAQSIDLKLLTTISMKQLNHSKIPMQSLRLNNGPHHPKHHRPCTNYAYSTT